LLNKKENSDSTLFVDLDGTLTATDILFESIVIFLKNNPFRIIYLFLWCLSGKAYLKEQLSQKVDLNISILPYRQEVLEYIREAKLSGQQVVLATATHHKIANAISNHLAIFNDVIATNRNINLKGNRKLDAILDYVGEQSFDYIGDSKSDVAIWRAARKTIIINPSASLLKTLSNNTNVRTVKTGKGSNNLIVWIKAIRIHQWSKNFLLFLPLIMAHRLFDFNLLLENVLAFVSFSLTASAGYIFNDLIDLETDRQNIQKKQRPFASGMLSVKSGSIAFLSLILVSFTTALFTMPKLFSIILFLYFIITMAYSLFLKSKVIIDVITLSILYNIRIIAGGISIAIPISSWLIVFSTFLFTSLAFLKRYADLKLLGKSQKNIEGRGYLKKDIDFVRSSGIASGYISLLVLTLYIYSEHVTKLYKQPFLLWLCIPFILYYISRMWLKTNRGEMTNDPIIFIIKDYISYIILIIMAVIIFLSKTLDLHISYNLLFR